MSHRTHLSVASALVTAGLLVAAGTAHALDAKISGHVNRAIMWAGDGENNDFFFVDNENSNSRFRFTGSEEILPGVKAGVRWEMEFVSNNSSRVTISNDQGFSPDIAGADEDFDLRHQDIYLETQYGKLSFGQGDGANNGAAEVDLSGTAVAHYSGAADIGGNIQFADNGNQLGVDIGDAFNQFDFESRYDRVRYDSPALGPVVLVGSFGKKGDDDTWEGGAKFSTDIAGIGKIAGAGGYSSRNRSGTRAGQDETFGGSVSFLSDLGPNLTVAYTMKENDDTDLDADTIYVKAGYKVGQHAVSVDWGYTRDLAEEDVNSYFVGGGYVFKPKSWIELFAAVKVHSLDDDRNAAQLAASDIGDLDDADDITIALVGSRIKF